MNRRHIHFSAKDTALRDDVSVLGTLVGAIIEEQAGRQVLTQVDTARRAAIRARQGDRDASATLSDVLAEVEDISSFIRAYSVYFQIVNLAERVHRIRRRRDYLRTHATPQPGSLEEAMQKLAASGVSFAALQKLLDGLLVEPIFTAHPTEATRRSILRKHLQIVRMLVERIDPSLSPVESRRLLSRIQAEITTLWQTEEHPESSRTVSDESEHVLFYLSEILYRIVPPFYEALREAAAQTFGDEALAARYPICLRYGSWVGGDMDGNPNVTADTILATVRRHRATILSRYSRELDGLYDHLTQSGAHAQVSQPLIERIEAYSADAPGLFDQFPVRHVDMPYRRIIRLIQHRLEAILRQDAHGYTGPSGLIDDLEMIAASLKTNKGTHAGLFLVERLLTRVRTFEFHLAGLDLRQDSDVHRQCVAKMLSDDTWPDRPAADRTAKLLKLLGDDPPRALPDDEIVAATLAVFATIGRARSEIGDRTIGLYIISMTQGVDDILSVLALAWWAGLGSRNDTPLDVTPLFETVGDLQSAPRILDELFSCPIYRSHLETRGNRQVVMIGYSDSGKDGGIAAARWALHEAQAQIVAVAEEHGIEVSLFHGRGGTISRGGGRLDRAVEASPEAYGVGRLRLTEQGEVINQRYGVRDIAERTTEQMVSPILLAAAGVIKKNERPAWDDMGRTLAAHSRRSYRTLVYETPGFIDYFRSATPIDVIERMQIGSRPAARRSQQGIENLRAIPWVFAWTQSRHQLTGWFGVGAGLQAAIDQFGREALREAVLNWPYLSALLSDIERDLAAADLEIAAAYAQLTGATSHPVYEKILAEYDRSIEVILDLKGAADLLEEDEVLRRSIDLRNPYIDPLNLLQVRLLREWRNAGRPDDDHLRLLVSSINGISQGIQNTG